MKKAQQISNEALEKVTSPITKTQLIRNIAQAQAGKHQQESAIENYLLAIKVSKKTELGETHFETANSYVILADYYWKLSNYKQALEYYVVAHRVFEVIFGEGDTELADVLLKQSICEMNLSNFDNAISLIQEAEKNLLYSVPEASPQSAATNSFTNIRLADIYFWWGGFYIIVGMSKCQKC